MTPPFRVRASCASPAGSLGNALRARKLGADIALAWPLGILSIDRFNVMRADGDKTTVAKNALPGSYTAPVLNASAITSGSYSDSGPCPPPGTAFHCEVYRRDCAGASTGGSHAPRNSPMTSIIPTMLRLNSSSCSAGIQYSW